MVPPPPQKKKKLDRVTLKQFGQAASNTSENRDTRAVFSASHFTDEFAYVLLCCAMYFSFSFAFHRGNLVLFPLNLACNSFYTVENPNVHNLSVKFNFHLNHNAVFFFFFSKFRGRNNAKYAFQNTFKSNTTQ